MITFVDTSRRSGRPLCRPLRSDALCDGQMIDDMKHEKHTIGFDAKRANANRTGLGNYSRFVIDALAEACGDRAYLRLYIPKRKANAEFDALTARENVESCMWHPTPPATRWRSFTV